MLCAFGASGALAQPADNMVDEIVVIGSQVQGSKITEAVPVTVLGQDELQSVAAASGDELFRSIPQMGDVSFNSSYLPNSSNSARGDVGSVNLRNLGVGNTLVLLNGRRVVTHPSSRADENLVPVLTYNTNAIPVNGLQRLEVLRDGAAALYGSDAVAGVVNTVLRTDYDGLTLDASMAAPRAPGCARPICRPCSAATSAVATSPSSPATPTVRPWTPRTRTIPPPSIVGPCSRAPVLTAPRRWTAAAP